mgnify:CR=1 FL=1
MSTVWESVQLARHAKRPLFLDYVANLFTEFDELHGDRAFADDKAIVGGLARFNDKPVLVVGQHRGRSTRERIAHNFGMANPEGYRKVIRLVQMAERFNLPVFTFIDTQGAYPGVGAEERGQAEAIAKSIAVFSSLKTPIISTVIGEGGSGGALALAVADKVWMLENTIYSILSPEGFATILWKDGSRSEEAAELMKITSGELLNMGIVDKVIPERGYFTSEIIEAIKTAIVDELAELSQLSTEDLLEARYQRFRKY